MVVLVSQIVPVLTEPYRYRKYNEINRKASYSELIDLEEDLQ
jgi:hypothetical protein